MEALNTAGIRLMLVLGTMLVVAAIATRAFRSAALLAATMAAGGALVELLKSSPLGPLPALGEVASRSTSWPSGHAALQGSLAFGIVFWWWAADLPRPSVVAAIVLPFAVLVGYSRAYLGIHLLSDVLAGWLVAVIAAAFILVLDRLVAPRLTFAQPSAPWRVVAAGIVALLLTAVAVGIDRQIHDRAPRRFSRTAPRSEPTRLSSDDPAAILGLLPRFSETLLGRRAQPLGLVVVVKDDDRVWVWLWRRAGWTAGERSRPSGSREMPGRASPRGPVSSAVLVRASRSRRPSSTRGSPTSWLGAAPPMPSSGNSLS